jgi:hypothetical protein
MLKEVELGEEAIKYIRHVLSQGGMLSNHLLDLPLQRGQVRTWLPTNVDPASLTAFEMGGVITGEMKKEVELKFADLVSKYLSESGTRYALFEHALARASDPFLLSVGAKFLICQSQVYFFLTSGDQDVREVLNTAKTASTYLFTGVLANLPDTLEIRNHQEVTEEVLRTVVDKTEYFIVGAFDGEGYLTWSRH